jgi:adenylylsulfate kinase
VRELVGAGNFIEVYCRCPVEVCESRDEKGNYAKARAGGIAHFTGVSAPYEAPERPDLVLDTNRTGVGESIATLLSLLRERNVIAQAEAGHGA